MDRHKGGVRMRVCDRDSCPERDELVIVACHHNAVAAIFEDAAKALRHVQRKLLFTNALAGNTAAINATVPGIDHDRAGLRTCLDDANTHHRKRE